MQGLLKRIGVDGVRYEEFFITSFDGDVLGLYDYLTEYENLDELNHLPAYSPSWSKATWRSLKRSLTAANILPAWLTSSIWRKTWIATSFIPVWRTMKPWGRIYVEDMEAIDIPDHLLPYFDYEAYGRDVRINEDGHFAPGGYVLNNGGKFIEHYHGIEDIPAEHKVFAFPQLSVREQMAAYKEMIDGSSLEAIGRLPKRSTRSDSGTSGHFVQRRFFHGKEGYG